MPPARAGALAALLLCGACTAAAPPVATAFDASRGGVGAGEQGYDRATARAEARAYRERAARRYAVPGPPHDPWGPHVQEAAARFGVPERWIREVMRQETGGRLHDGRGQLITSPVGAMGLMQVMPATWRTLSAQHGLGEDPYHPRDNILAGAAYIREMHDRFGAPGFIAAYNAGPERVELVLAGAQIMPDETINYVARIAPRIGVAVTGPFAGDGPVGELAEAEDAPTGVVPASLSR